MADPRRVRLTHEERFPAGAFAVAVEAVQEFDAEKGRTGVQAREKDSGLPLWVVMTFDPDPEARSREVKVRIASTEEPVLPPLVAVPGVLEGLRPVVGGTLAEWLSGPLGTHEFLNVRTYVRHGPTRGKTTRTR